MSSSYQYQEGDGPQPPDPTETAMTEVRLGRSGAFGPAGRAAFAFVFALLVVAGLGLVIAGFTLSTGSDAAPDQAPSIARVGSRAPDFELRDVATSQPVRLSALRGKPVWINFWATWCAPCRDEMPQMKEAYARYKGQGLVLLGIDIQDSPETVSKFVKQGGFDWTFVIDASMAQMERYNVNGIPMHLFVDRDGVLRSSFMGPMPADALQSSLSEILGP